MVRCGFVVFRGQINTDWGFVRKVLLLLVLASCNPGGIKKKPKNLKARYRPSYSRARSAKRRILPAIEQIIPQTPVEIARLAGEIVLEDPENSWRKLNKFYFDTANTFDIDLEDCIGIMAYYKLYKLSLMRTENHILDNIGQARKEQMAEAIGLVGGKMIGRVDLPGSTKEEKDLIRTNCKEFYTDIVSQFDKNCGMLDDEVSRVVEKLDLPFKKSDSTLVNALKPALHYSFVTYQLTGLMLLHQKLIGIQFSKELPKEIFFVNSVGVGLLKVQQNHLVMLMKRTRVFFADRLRK